MATDQEKNELKQQGAIEASRDPDSSVTPADAEKKIMEESKSAGVAAYSFDPDASPEEKKAQARAVSSTPHAKHLPFPRFANSSRRFPRASTIPSELKAWPS